VRQSVPQWSLLRQIVPVRSWSVHFVACDTMCRCDKVCSSRYLEGVSKLFNICFNKLVICCNKLVICYNNLIFCFM
jgi:hypothetical protein